MRLTALTPFGTEATDFLVSDADDATIAALRDALSEEGVLVLREQSIDDDAFLAFLQRFGPTLFTSGEVPLAHRPELNFVTNEGRTTPPRSVFHTDTSYVAEPPALTALRAVLIPEKGGETVFSNQFDAFERLDDALKVRLAKAEVLHEVTGVEPRDGETRYWHPLFRRHPISGRTALYLSTPERCTAIRGVEGMSEEDGRGEVGRALIAELFAHSTQGDGLLRHRWRPGDVVMWDDRSTLHKADHSAVSGTRRLHRGMVRGERPLAA